MEPFKAGWHIYKVPVYESSTNGMTFFTEHDNWLAKLCVWASVYILAFAAVLQIAKRVSQKKASHD
jgi:steroid 5-alpha reductase family enzyme